jgi:phenylacetate-CoA ligase
MKMFRLYKSPDYEFFPVDEILNLQNELLQKHIKYLSEKSPFYQKIFASYQIDPFQIRTVEDLSLLPFTTKEDITSFFSDFLCVPEAEIIDICLTSGTTAEPITICLTLKDLDRLGYNEEISLRTTGITENDRVLVAVAMDRCFMAGLAYFLGLNRIGATVIRGGSSSLPVLVELVRKFRPTAIIGVPTLLLSLANHLEKEGQDPAEMKVQRLVCIGEPIRKKDFSLMPLGELLKRKWRTKLFGTYASSEMATAFCECEQGRGGHVHPDLIIIEIVDDAGKVLPPGEPGEVIATPLGITGMPLLRYKTGDIAILYPEPCPCGRNSYRLSPILGRKSQALKYRGTTVYPPAIFAVLQEIPSVRGYYIEAYSRYELSDHVRVVVGTTDNSLTSEYIAAKIAASIRVKPEVILTTPEEISRKTIQPDKRKPVLFFDYRRR